MRSIYLRLIIPITAYVAIALLASLYFIIASQRNEMETRYYQTWDTRAELITDTLGPVLNDADIALAQWLGEKYFKYDELKSLEIRNLLGGLVFQRHNEASDEQLYTYELDALSPLDEHSKIGSVMIGIDEFSQASGITFLNLILWPFAILLILSAAIILHMRWRVLLPLSWLHRDVTNAETEQDAQPALDRDLGSRELNELRESFRQVLRDIRRKERNERDLLAEQLQLYQAADRALAGLQIGMLVSGRNAQKQLPTELGRRCPDALYELRSSLDGGSRELEACIRKWDHPISVTSIQKKIFRTLSPQYELSAEITFDDEHWRVSYYPLDDGGVLLYGDISQEIKQRKEYGLARKNETVGKLTGGVAHDFNNILSVVQSNTEFFIETNPNFGKDESLLAVLAATRKASDLTRSLLYFAKEATLITECANLNDTLQQVMKWVVRILPETIDIETVLQQGLWDVNVDVAMAENSVLNIIINARDAMEAGGTLTVETANVRVDEEYIDERNETIRAGRYVMVAITDTGHGIKKDDIENIFDPFFTTKAPGKGSGVGLSMIHGFMKQSQGTIRVYSEVGVGTTFKMLFPALETRRREAGRVTRTLARPTTGARILLVEDDQMVSDAITRVLASAGYQVTLCINGDEAYEAYMATPQDYDVILTDVVMPGELNGPMLIRKIRETHKDVKVAFMSGYTQEATVHGNGLSASDIRLVKPVDRITLIESIERLMQEKNSAL